MQDLDLRIVCLVPSLTLFLYDLGLANQIVGVTKFCIYPKHKNPQPQKIGGTKNPNLQLIQDLRPTLVICNKEENNKADVLALQNYGLNVLLTDIDTYKQALESLIEIGKLTGKSSQAKRIIDKIEAKQSSFNPILKGKTVLYYIWKNPDMVVGSATFIDDMLRVFGFQNICQNQRYPIWDYSTKSQPDFVFLSDEPFPFSNKHLAYFKEKFPKSKLVLVRGDAFSWYGSMMEQSFDYINELSQTLKNTTYEKMA